MGGRRQLVFRHSQLRAAREKPVVSSRYWRGRARRDEVQPRKMCLALPTVSADAGSFTRHNGVSARTGNGNNYQELEKVRCWKIQR